MDPEYDAPKTGIAAHFVRFHAFEFLIFATLFTLLALCVAAAPLAGAAVTARARAMAAAAQRAQDEHATT
jgi:uncharacterized membrane protein